MEVIWAPEAEDDLHEIIAYIGRDDPGAAKRLKDAIEVSVGRLAVHPAIGRVCVVKGTREIIPHRSYRVVYEVRDDKVQVTAVVHAARQWPPEDGLF